MFANFSEDSLSRRTPSRLTHAASHSHTLIEPCRTFQLLANSSQAPEGGGLDLESNRGNVSLRRMVSESQARESNGTSWVVR